jgi:aryl-alcohol dehydrogenase-like predicted oxidoreductase
MKTKPRDAVMMATKVSGPSHGWFKSAQRHAMTALGSPQHRARDRGSLKRLQTDYVDLYQTHWPDHGVAYDEHMLALDELVKAKARCA